MDNLRADSLDWAITHIRRYGDTDIFPIPFEYEAIRHSWEELKRTISEYDLSAYEGRPHRRILVPKQDSNFRVAVQLDPIDSIVYLALAYEAADEIESMRVPVQQRVACSYRVAKDSKGSLYQESNGWDDYHSRSRELAESGDFSFVLTADIADFYNHISHHRLRNALETAGVSHERSKNIENILMNFTRGHSRGIPVGPSASSLFAEACLSDVDNFLMRRGYVHTRYVDDFRIFTSSRSSCLKVIHDLTEYLYTAHRLSLQANKTRIKEVGQFIEDELIDPSEIAEKSKEDRLRHLQRVIDLYEGAAAELSETDNEAERNSLAELFVECLESEPIHFGTLKYILRRATVLKTGLLREAVLGNLPSLAPVMREVSNYILATTSNGYEEAVGKRLIDGLRRSELWSLPYIQIWLNYVLILKMAGLLRDEISDLANNSAEVLGIRSQALLAKSLGYIDWVREQKETWQNNSPWSRRAVIWSASALSGDELSYWLMRVQNAGDELDKAIAASVLQQFNNSRASNI
jgi:hypothetical protein